MRQMDQELLDTGRFKIFNLSLDSRFADTYYQGTGDWLIRLPTVYKNIMRVALSSIEIPNVAWVFSNENGNLNIGYTIGTCCTSPLSCQAAPEVMVSIPPGNYTACNLAAAVQTALRSGAGGAAFTVTISETTGQITISNPSAFSLFFASTNPAIAARSRYWGLGFWLGFRENIVDACTLVGGVAGVTGTGLVLVQPAPYYIIQLLLTGPERVDDVTHMVGQGDSVIAFAKVVLRDGVYALNFDDNANLLRKEMTFMAPVNIPQARFRVLDPWGNVVNLLDVDWSCTVEFYEVVNSRTHRRLQEGFGLR
jgi:hypothetical protein